MFCSLCVCESGESEEHPRRCVSCLFLFDWSRREWCFSMLCRTCWERSGEVDPASAVRCTSLEPFHADQRCQHSLPVPETRRKGRNRFRNPRSRQSKILVSGNISSCIGCHCQMLERRSRRERWREMQHRDWKGNTVLLYPHDLRSLLMATPDSGNPQICIWSSLWRCVASCRCSVLQRRRNRRVMN